MEQSRDKLVTEIARLARQMLALCDLNSAPEVLTISQEDAKERDRRLARHQCLQCSVIESETEIFRRGLHEACYQASRRKIQAGETTWAQLEAAGLALAPTAGGRPAREAKTRLDAFLAGKTARDIPGGYTLDEKPESAPPLPAKKKKQK